MLQLVRKFTSRTRIARLPRRAPAPDAHDSHAEAQNAGAPGTIAALTGSRNGLLHREDFPRRPGGTSAGYWSQAEVELLIHWEQQHRPVRVEMDDGKVRQTLILGVDLINNQLLLDSMVPGVTVRQIEDNQPFWLVIATATGNFRVCVLARQFGSSQRADMLVDIVATRFVAHTEVVSPLTFVDEAQPLPGPKVVLQLSSGKRLVTRLHQLSEEGLLLAADRAAGRELRSARGDVSCTIQFNSAFAIHCHVRANRYCQPRAGTLTALTFTDLSGEARQQLRRFLTECSKVASQGNAAA